MDESDRKDTSAEDLEFIEPILDESNFRYTIKPINPKYEILWKLYQKQLNSMWKAQEIDYTNDYNDFIKLTVDEQNVIKMILAFFAASDGIVNFNLRERFLTEIKITEAQVAYSFQLMMENIHGEVYSDMLINIIKDTEERTRLFNAMTTIDSVKKMTDWALKWISSRDSIAHRIIAFAIIEGVFFSGAFAAIFWLKKTRGNGKLFMEGLIKSNRFISRDEGLHLNFACALYSFIVKRVSVKEVYELVNDALLISNEFCRDTIRVDMIGMNLDMMNDYIKYMCDYVLVSLGYEKLYLTSNPFDFMDTMGLDNKDNFFENRSDAYQSAHNEDTANWVFTIEEDF
jgi:ribonucleotide reductase beta subunit family protein with ferritin-like domain